MAAAGTGEAPVVASPRAAEYGRIVLDRDAIYRVYEGLDQWGDLMGGVFLVLGALALVVIGFGLWQAKQPSLGTIGLGFGLVGLASAFLGAAVPVVLFLGTGVVGFGLVVASRPER